MNSERQDKGEEKLTIRKITQRLVQNKKDNSSSKQNLEENKLEESTELFYIKKIKAIQLKYTILKIISCGCFNHVINKQLKSKIKPWLDELNELQNKNCEQMLKINEWIEQAESMIIKNSKQRYVRKIVVEQKAGNDDEAFEDALDDQPWLELKEMHVDEKDQQTLVNSHSCLLIT